ncbi:2-nitropropane dioxygenase [Mycena chlorophos]|uniref:2-nitropropane dioxygenase n=1 Tax=Mycena chlorophos TaxID=658473 RepID=A0A8H6SVS4_MYCCL|nr:2-nitropropane dioxygenase [Mycena chlorophos]
MPSIKTRLTERLGLQTPIISAPMAFATTPEMVVAVTKAGGFGTFSAAFDSTEVINQNIQRIRELLEIAQGETVPIAIGFGGWILDMTEVSDDPRLEATLDERPAAIWLSFGEFGKYIRQIREHDERTARGWETFIFAQVGCLEDALRYAPEVDCLVLQGIEAGGHGRADAPPLLTLLQAVMNSLPEDNPNKPLLVAAGGITTGAQIAGLLTMGAAGVAIGTRFLFTPESRYAQVANSREALLAAGLNGTVRTLAYNDVARVARGWPPHYDGRAIRNAVMDDFEAGLSVEERLARFDAGQAAGEAARIVVWAGIGAGLVEDIRPTEQVLKELHEGAVEHLHASVNFVVNA